LASSFCKLRNESLPMQLRLPFLRRHKVSDQPRRAISGKGGFPIIPH
jgi:hypothetical protein